MLKFRLIYEKPCVIPILTITKKIFIKYFVELLCLQFATSLTSKMTAKPDDSFDSLDQTLNELTEEQLKELENNPSFNLGIDFERFKKLMMPEWTILPD